MRHAQHACSCAIGSAGINALRAAVDRHPRLTSIDVSGNPSAKSKEAKQMLEILAARQPPLAALLLRNQATRNATIVEGE